MEERIHLIIRKHTGNLLSESKKLFESLEESLIYHSNYQDELLGRLSGTGKSVIKGMLSAPTRKIADAVIKARNFLQLPFKFKPWGAIKFAKFLKVMPAVMEALSLAGEVWSKFKMEKKRREIKNEMENSFKGLIERLTLEDYMKTYFPFISETRRVLTTIENSKAEIEVTIVKIDQISNELNINNFDRAAIPSDAKNNNI